MKREYTYKGITYRINHEVNQWYFLMCPDGQTITSPLYYAKKVAISCAHQAIDEFLQSKSNSMIVSVELQATCVDVYSDVIKLKNGCIVRINELGVAVYANYEADDNNEPINSILFNK